ncbi:MAG: EamA family transporter RarD [Sphingomonas sp.]|uniref:EamA family transporter RarD n=1 Tax=Sphingomonas sp. TaxID=28214 RepID=UPI0025F941DC|nr:EamA family transporter RarD [Sphingomonas sp.]MBX9881197.1 EamA family transporter RarD [Sphingomonas sp.]
MNERTRGLALALGAYGIWGLLPLYFVPLRAVGAIEVVAHRICWSLLLLGAIVLFSGRWPKLRAALTSPSTLGRLTASALLIAVNWLVYIWSVETRHVVEASLGYFLNPLVNVLLGVALLGERLGRAQMLAVALATIGVAVLGMASGVGQGLWVSLTLAISFGLYGLVRKVTPVEALEGLLVETLVLAPLASGYLLWHGTPGLALGGTVPVLLLASGAATAAPLLMFAGAARRLPLSVLGLVQYLAPSLQFVIAVALLGERLTTAHVACFALIWTGLAVVAVDGLRAARRRAGQAT